MSVVVQAFSESVPSSQLKAIFRLPEAMFDELGKHYSFCLPKPGTLAHGYLLAAKAVAPHRVVKVREITHFAQLVNAARSQKPCSNALLKRKGNILLPIGHKELSRLVPLHRNTLAAYANKSAFGPKLELSTRQMLFCHDAAFRAWNGPASEETLNQSRVNVLRIKLAKVGGLCITKSSLARVREENFLGYQWERRD